MISGHAQVYWRDLSEHFHGIDVVLQPVRRHLFVQDGVAGIRRVFEDEKEPQAQTGGERDNWVRENSLHQRNASYNRADVFRQTDSVLPDVQAPAGTTG